MCQILEAITIKTMQLKLTWKEFINLAYAELRYKIPQAKWTETVQPSFVVDRTEGEGEICEQPDFVYIELPDSVQN